MSNNTSGAVVGVLGMGTVYLLSVAFVQVMLFAALGALVVIAVGFGLIVSALLGWKRCLGEARRDKNNAWMFDLIAAPLWGLLMARIFGTQFADWMTVPNSEGGLEPRGFDLTGSATMDVVLGVVGIGAFILWVYLVFATPKLLAIPNNTTRRWAVYPAFTAYGIFYGGYVISWIWMAGL